MAATILFTAASARAAAAGTIAGTLNRSVDIGTADVCAVPTADTGGPYTVSAGGTVRLGGTTTGTAPLTLLWTVGSGSLSDPSIVDPLFTAVNASSTVDVTLTATNACGTATAGTTITVNAALPPVFGQVPPIVAQSGTAVVVLLSATDPNVPPQPLTFSVTQSGTPALINLTVTSTGPSTATLTFDTPVLACGQPSVIIVLTIIVINPDGTETAVFTTVTIFPPPDVVTITSADDRIHKLRLDVTATSNCVSPNVVLALQPYLTTTGATFDPAPSGNIFLNIGNGVYTLLEMGVPQVASTIVVKSNHGGVSPAFLVNVKK